MRLLAVFLALLAAVAAGHAVVTTTPVMPQALLFAAGQSTNALPGTSVAPITVVDCTAAQAPLGYDCSTHGAKVNGLSVFSTNTSATLSTINCAIRNAGTNYIFWRFSIGAAIATSTTVAGKNGLGVDALGRNATTPILGLPRDDGTNKFIFIGAGGQSSLVCWASAVTTGVINYLAVGAIF